jgi:hypothetical protein
MKGRPIKDLQGKTFGLLTVLAFAEMRGQDNSRAAYWRCKCICGRENVVRGSALTGGKAKSCGCLLVSKIRQYNVGRRHDPWQTEMNSHRYHIGWDREHKNKLYKTWGLSLEEYKRLCISPCFYCGASPSNTPGTKLLRASGVKKSGIDRRDNKKGYEPHNCVPCCTSCNLAKGTQTMCAFIEKTIQRYEHLKAHGWLQPEEPTYKPLEALLCRHRDWLPEQSEDDMDAAGPECGKPATHLSCVPYLQAPSCEAHKCRCAKPVPNKESNHVVAVQNVPDREG